MVTARDPRTGQFIKETSMPTVALPAKVRGPLYLAYGILGVCLGATQVGYAAAEAGQPVWLTVALSVFAFLGTGFGLTAASNTNADEPADDAAGE